MKKAMLTILVCGLLATSMRGQMSENRERGFSADKLYQFGNVDSVNLFNGNLILAIPIGRPYVVSPQINYGLVLTYNASVWEYDKRCYYLDNWRFGEQRECIGYALPNPTANAGLGWSLTLGELLPPFSPYNHSSTWTYLSPDGGKHGFNDAGGPSRNALTHDQTFLRLRDVGNGVREIDFPDGVIRRFEGSGDIRRLVEIRDRFSQGTPGAVTTNFVRVSYATDSGDAETWTITDSAGRTQKVHLRSGVQDLVAYQQQLTTDNGGHLPPPRNLVSRVELTAFATPSSDIYSFTYDSPNGELGTTITRDNDHDSDPDLTQTDAKVALLTGVTLADGSSYSMSRGDGTPDYETLNAMETSGVLYSLTLPTSGTLAWTYERRIFPQPGDQESVRPVLANHDFRVDALSVKTRTLTDPIANTTSVWTYTPVSTPIATETCPTSHDPTFLCKQRELVVTVIDPLNIKTENFFSTCVDMQHTADGWTRKEYGRPLTHSDTTFNNRFLSTRLWKADGTGVQQSSYVAFESSAYNPIDEFGFELRQKATRTVFNGDAGCPTCWTDTESSDFDGYGHYRTVKSTNNFPSSDPAQPMIRTTFTNYNGATSANGEADTAPNGTRAGELAFPPNVPWVIGTYTEQRTTVTPHGATSPVLVSEALFDFDPANGFLRRRRTMLELLPQERDILAVFTHDTKGNTDSESYYGGDTQSLDTQHYYPETIVPPASPLYRIDHTYLDGVMTTSTYKSGSSPFLQTLDLTIDPGTGLVAASKDPAGLETTYEYSTMGRISRIAPPSSTTTPAAPTRYTYHNATASAGAYVETDQPDDGSLTHASVHFDGFGKPVRSVVRMPEGDAVELTEYNANGWKTRVSEREATPSHFTVFSDFDSLGRAQTITAPGSTTENPRITHLHFDGSRQTQKTVNVATGSDGSESPSTTTETYDGFGRLREVSEPSGSDGHAVSTFYRYDGADRMIEAKTTDNGVTQTRSYEYDNRGFLLSETQPEKGASGNGTTYYTRESNSGGYDARGHLLRKRESGSTKYDQDFLYDAAERLTLIKEHATGRAVKEFKYDAVTDAGHPYSSTGRLVKSLRHNYSDALTDVPVATYLKYDAAGRVASKETAIGSGPSFLHQFTYTPLGAPAALTYPGCTGCGAATLPAREIALTYSKGLLTEVGGFASAITYWPNGMMHTVAHTNNVVDTQEIDPATAMPRPLSIAFTGYCVGPSINTSEPANKSVASGSTAVVTVTAQSGLTYQWYTGTPDDAPLHPISGATGSSYTTGVLTANATYWVRASNATCSTDSRVATVTVKACSELSIRTQPLDDFIGEGASASVRVVVDVPSGLNATYQWYQGFRGDTTHLINGATSDTYNIPSLAATTHYWVRVRVEGGTCAVDSITATISVCAPPVITGVPQRQQSVSVGTAGTVSVTLSVTATGDHLTYAWYAGTSTGPTPNPDNALGHEPRLTISYTAANAGVHDYFVLVSDTNVPSVCSGTAKADATVTVYGCNLDLSIWPPAGTVYPGATTFTLTVGQNQVAPRTIYKWYHGISGVVAPLPAFTTGSMTVGLASNYDAFWCEVSVPVLDSNGDVVTDNQENPVIACSATTPKAYVKLLGLCPLPALTAGPASQVTTPGVSKTFVASVDWPDVTYQWYAGSSGDTRIPIAGATGKALTVGSTAQAYWCRVTDECGSAHVDSQTLLLLVNNNGATCSPIVINHQPQSVDIASGANTTLQVDANGITNLTYQWSLTGSEIPLGSEPSLTVHPTVTTSYYAKIVQMCGTNPMTVTTLPATVHVRSCNGISIDNQPANIVVVAGTSGSLHVDATSSDTISYQWYAGENGDTAAPVPGGTTATVTVSPAQTTSYWVRLTTSSCTIDSLSASAIVCHPPVISFISGVNPLVRGQSTTLNLGVSGTDLTYQWYTGASGSTATPIVNATGPSITVTPMNQTTYWVRVTSPCGTLDSEAVTVTVCALPSITTQPHDASIFSGATTTLTVAATQATNTPITYQWYRGLHGDMPHPVGTGTSFTTPALTEDTSYWVAVACGTCGPVESQTATVSLCPYAATLQAPSPASTNTSASQIVRLTEVVNGAPQFRWYEGPSGDTTHPLGEWPMNSFIDVSPAATTLYWAQVRNNAGACVSSSLAATINVCIPTVTQQPASSMINSGQPVTLTVVANTPNLTYQWYLGASGTTTNPITNATSSSLTVSPASTTSYWVRVTGSCGVSTDSSTAAITICQPAAITTQPPAKSIVRGQSVSIDVIATGTNLSYQWYQGASGNTSTLIFGNTSFITVTPQNPIDYWVKVTSSCGVVNSATAHVSVCLTPSITAQPQNASVFSGSAATLSISASETTTEPMHYQWFKGVSSPAAICSDATTCSTGALTTQTQFWVRITAGSCSVGSAAATVSICPLAASVAGPPNANSSPGQTVRLQFGALSGATAYAWYRGNGGDTSLPLSGGFQANNYFDVSPSVTTNYWAQVQNGSCVSSSTTTTVTVCIPVITSQPSGSTVTSGSPATMSVTSNLPGSTYQWYVGASGTTTSPVSGATSASVTVSPSATTTYWCRVSGSCGSANSNAATITVCSPPAITQQPVNASPSQRNASTGLSVTATGTSLTYQWYLGASGDTSQPIGGQTNASFTLNAVNSERYWVRVSGMCGSVNSNAAWISVYPVMVQQPQAVTMSYGSTATFTVSASGTYLHYTWRQSGGQPASGGTDSPTYRTGSIYSNTSFYCDITSSIATTSSYPANATICDGPGIISMPVQNYGSCKNIVVNPDRPIDNYLWYQGPRGNTTTLVSQGGNELWVCPSTSTTYWCRLVTGSCYTDSPAVTVP